MAEFKHTVLCVDDEANILNALKRLLRKETYRLLTCTSGKEGLDLLAQNEVHMVISDQRMPEMNGSEFLRQVNERYPHIIRIILTGYTEVDTITKSINEGHIYKFFLKPWNDQHLTLEIRQALEQYDLIEANKELHKKAIAQNEELKRINENLEDMVRERTQSLEIQNQALQLSHAILEDLPLPVIGISAEMMIVLVNKAAQHYFGANQLLQIGDHICEYFDGFSESQLTSMIGSAVYHRICGQCKSGQEAFEMELRPLTGRYAGRGAILSIKTDLGSATWLNGSGGGK
jgi:response regulator RpfG family c-di-GMP phosphodiesterase